MKYKRHKKLIYFAGISILLSLIGYYFVSKNIYPYELVQVSNVHCDREIESYLIEDLDDNGYSEQIIIRNSPEEKVYYLTLIEHSQEISRTKNILNQFNFNHPFKKNSWYFSDINRDSKKEIVIFNQDNDTLYLSIIDVYNEGWIVNQRPVLSAEYPLNYHKWDIQKILSVSLENKNQKYNDLVFGIHVGYALKPRGLYLFDVNKQVVRKKFLTNSAITGLFKFDLNNDGEDEIILSGKATGNISPEKTYSDQTCWLYIFDRDLNLKFPPKSFGEFPSDFQCYPVFIKDKKFLFITYNYVGRKNYPNSTYLINSEFNIELKQDIYGHIITAFIYDGVDRSKIILSLVGGRILLMDPTLKIINEKSFPYKFIKPHYMIDLNEDNKKELINVSNKGIHIFNENLSQNAIYEKGTSPIFIKSTGVNNPVDIVSESLETPSYYQLEYSRNLSYSLLPAIFTGIALLIFGFFLGLERINASINIYLAFFLYYMQKNKNAMIILNKNGRITHINQQTKLLPYLANSLIKGELYATVFSGNELILSGVRQVFENGKKVRVESNTSRESVEPTGDILISPFKDIFKSVTGILIEITDTSEPSQSDRLKIWSIAMQKIAHEIKTPLSTIALNLRALQMRLEKSELKDRTEYKNDIQLIHGEVERLTALTKNFLKFSNLEKLNIQLYDISQISKNSLQSFRTYFNHNLQVSLNFDPKAKKIYADSKQLEMVLHILIENAIDAMKGKGLISISTVLAEDILKNGTKYIEIEIADSGPGIEEDIKEKIFDPQFSTKFDGTGMGLAIAKKVIEDHKGTIEVHTRENFGTVFRITLPFQK